MSVKLIVLDGLEAGVEINIEKGKIFSVGTGADCDFYLQKKESDFTVFFSAINEQIEWWSNKKIAFNIEDKTLELSSAKTLTDYNKVLEISGRKIGVFSDDKLAQAAVDDYAPEEPEVEHDVFLDSEADEDAVDDTLAEDNDQESTELDDQAHQQAAIKGSTLADKSKQNKNNDNSKDSEDENDNLNKLPTESIETSFIGTIPLPASKKNKKIENDETGNQVKDKSATSTEKNKKLFTYIKFAPFAIGIIVFIIYASIQYRSGGAKRLPTVNQQNETKQEQRKNANANDQDNKFITGVPNYDDDNNVTIDESGNKIPSKLSTAETRRGMLSEQDGSTSERFIASGGKYKSDDQWRTVEPAEDNGEDGIENIRDSVINRTADIKQTKEILFPDEKMMTLIKDMLDTAGAEGIDVRFDRGSYDVFGYVRDDKKWSRIFKILTFDLDLSKVKFSVETSVSLMNKFEELLRKFNLSNYVVLSLGADGQMFAKTYYPPALEGLWLTIKTRFEKKYGQYTTINEYRAHLGWINVVKVSFDQPSYILLGDGRRIVEGSVIGGDSVLDAILEDSVRVKSSSSKLRYYLINKPSRTASSDLSQL